MWRIALLLTLGISACGDGPTVPGAPLGWGPASSTLYSPPTVGAGILGDWFVCQDERCETLANNGLRFKEDGTWILLEAPDAEGGYVLGAEYCLTTWTGTYTWDGATLWVHSTPDNDDLVFRVTFDGDIATLRGEEELTSRLRRVSADQVEPCPIEVPVPGGD